MLVLDLGFSKLSLEHLVLSHLLLAGGLEILHSLLRLSDKLVLLVVLRLVLSIDEVHLVLKLIELLHHFILLFA